MAIFVSDYPAIRSHLHNDASSVAFVPQAAETGTNGLAINYSELTRKPDGLVRAGMPPAQGNFWADVETRLSSLRSLFDALISDAMNPPTIPSTTQQLIPDVSLQGKGEKLTDVSTAFTATKRNFGENFDCSTHAAVIQMMMMTFGKSPGDMFDEVKPAGDGYDITMKDEFKVHVSRDELQRAAQASRFAGNDPEALDAANMVFAAFVKRKQHNHAEGSFESALEKTIQGETTQRCLQGMGMFGLSQFVPASYITGKGVVGVLETHNFGAAVVVDGVKHTYGEKQRIDRDYGYMLFSDKQVPDMPPAVVIDPSNLKVSNVPLGVKPTDIWGGFYQGAEGNCVTVSAIKAAMMRFGQNPEGIFKKITATTQGYEVIMRDSFRLHVTHDELSRAYDASNLRGDHQQLLDDANFLYAVSAKRAYLENNDFRANQSFDAALQTLNDGEYPGEAFRRLGLYAYVRESNVRELANGAIGTLADSAHSVAVIGGALDLWGAKVDLASSRWMSSGMRALKLV